MKLLSVTSIFIATATSVASPVVDNVSVSMRSDARTVEIEYDLSGAPGIVTIF